MKFAQLAVLAAVALIGSGCSNDPAGRGASSTREQAVNFSECMRHNGVSEFPDPDASGELTLDGVVNGSSLNPDGAEFKKAMSACKDLEPAGFTGHKRNAQQQQTALAFAQCMREHGVRDFPDPAAGQPLVDTRRIPSSAQPGGMTILNAAMRTCGELAAKATGQ